MELERQRGITKVREHVGVGLGNPRVYMGNNAYINEM